jgi:hypothetical protein
VSVRDALENEYAVIDGDAARFYGIALPPPAAPSR